jgi:hypothetical protein
MRMLTIVRPEQLVKFASFLDGHPAFAPEFIGADASVYGFRVGKCFLSVEEMERLIDTPIEVRLASLLQPLAAAASRKRSR